MLTLQQQKLIAEAMQKLEEADALVQQALGASDECYELHCAIENTVDELQDKLREAEGA